jgi:hypothetical protein
VAVTGEQELASVHKKKATGFMTDEGSAFPLFAERFGWTHLLSKTFCYTNTSCLGRTFTAGHVSDQRMEQGMVVIKANGKLKSMLSECNYGEAISRRSECARDQDINALKELHSLQNASALNYLKRKSESMSEVVTKNTLSKKK